MARSISNKILESILQIVGYFPNGASLANIADTLTPSLPKRSLQRYLSFLLKEGRLNASGQARARRYFLPFSLKTDAPAFRFNESEVTTSTSLRETAEESSSIPLSPQALSIQVSVCRPIQARRPVGYNQDFLDKYHPNKTYYLPETTRKHLFNIGKSSETLRPAGTYAKKILNRLLIDLSWNSSRLEGNTYSLLETERLLELGESSHGKNSKEAQMILNHKAAIEFMIQSAKELKFNNFTIFNLHALLSDNLLSDQRACGALRLNPVGIGKSVYQPLSVPQLIQDYFEQILCTAEAIKDPFEQSFFVMVHLPYLQPFLDVNKRTSRLAANIPFICKNLCPLSFVDVPEETYINALLGVYELNRTELLRDVFVWAYERSCFRYSATRQELGEPDLFRLQYRTPIMELVADIVCKRMDKSAAVSHIKQAASQFIPKNDQAKFIEVVETELMSLHEGNIVRFKLNLENYRTWLKTWH